jgi:hypothetical protein
MRKSRGTNSVPGKDKNYREKETAKKSSKMSPASLPKVFLRKLFGLNCCFSLHYETTQKKTSAKLSQKKNLKVPLKKIQSSALKKAPC